MTACPVCDTTLINYNKAENKSYFQCPRCGSYSLSYGATLDLDRFLSSYKNSSARLSHAIYNMTKHQQWALVTSALLQNILENTELPRPQEQLENFVLWLGENQPNMGRGIEPTKQAISAAGVIDDSSLAFLISEMIDAGIINGFVREVAAAISPIKISPLRLTLKGWSIFEELQRGKSASRIAFMAMQFGDLELDRIYKEDFKTAVAATGFDLKRVDEGQPAGLIDDRLRVEIRQCRFLIADLTHQNRGAYWEAGFAEGLEKPVIYTCRKDVFEDKTIGTHFDTNHHLTVVWESGNIGEAVERLKATIRATLPDEARFDD